MTPRLLALDPDPASALETIRAASAERRVLVFKKSPICPVSHRAESELEAWRAALGEGDAVALAVVDVIAERGLARGLTAALDVRHESPQALVFENGELVTHASHGELTVGWFRQHVG